MTFACFQWDFSENLIDRTNFVATMFLAISAFLWVIDAETPRTPYLKSLDKVTVIAIAATVLIAIETIAIKQLTLWGLAETVAEPLDAGLGVIMCCIMNWRFCQILWNDSAEWRKLRGKAPATDQSGEEALKKLVQSQQRYSKVGASVEDYVEDPVEDHVEDLAEKKKQ
eukprot:CAMPEP_0174357436 /NCGR_PEP_ID=MMETSP0811_2-20130205/36016_1 /TAXON_ID=73025 ORGANISM="Eutreptiella gymnastica-like, Strain CCMP1594" /NCGR_SAMPLE_ID=MMETSP0811_2 /ASSEMBLY_ACC=CAM_ASM_000667 /LENGTH=168 /DNA_ID=CAMNT_0015490259 /DNA_START=14 /DNA_END=520 /DNA_ORIENTATION=+